MLPTVKLEKLKIHAYKDSQRQTKENIFEVMFNPQSYSLKYKNVFQSAYQGINTSARQSTYSLSRPSELSLTLILDSSGVITYASDNVAKQVEDFLELTCHMDGDIHEPKFLTIEWGELIFKCRLTSVEVNYKLFDRAGRPTRAELKTEFVGDIEESERLKKENKNSPDLTHVRKVMSGDNLPLMAHRIYNDSTYYLKLAQTNKLNNFRNLKLGSILSFAPIKDEVIRK